MANEKVIEKVKQLKKKYKRVRAVVMREPPNNYNVYVMVSYSGGKGMGFMGSTTAFGVTFKNKDSAEILKNRINRLK